MVAFWHNAQMKPFTDWSATLPTTSAALAACLRTPGSLTEYLMATGQPFAVQVLQQGIVAAHGDEAAMFQITPDSPLYARHVCLTLAGTPVVVARSVCLPHCPQWSPVLDRGSRSLGLTLFGGLPALQRDALAFARIEAAHPLFDLSRPHDKQASTHYMARRCRFELAERSLLVCEVFLPAVEDFL